MTSTGYGTAWATLLDRALLESLGFLCALFREPIAQHCGTKQKAPGLRRGLCSYDRIQLTG